MVDDQQAAAGSHRVGSPLEQCRPVHLDGAVQELCRYQIEGAGGETRAEIA